MVKTKTYQVWYMKPEWFRQGICGDRPDPMNLARTHVLLRELTLVSDTPGLGEVYHRMQGEIWSPNGEARSLIEEKGLQHTSMSVGDVIVDDDNGEVFLVKNIGFKNIGNIEPMDTDGVDFEDDGRGQEAANDRYATRSFKE